MKGLLLKDFYSIKPMLKQYIGMVLFFLIFAYMMKSPTYIIFMSMVMGLTLIFYTISIDEKGGFAYMLLTPISKKQLILEKYIFLFLEMGVLTVLSTILAVGVAILTGPSNIQESVLSLLAAAVLYYLFSCIILPVSIKWGTDRARIVFLAIVAIPTIGAYLIIKNKIIPITEAQIDHLLTTNIPTLVLISLLTIALMLLISYAISYTIFKKKEF